MLPKISVKKTALRLKWWVLAAYMYSVHYPGRLIQTKPGCSTFLVFRRWGIAYNERVNTVGIGWVLLASATGRFSGYRKLAYCSSAKGLQ